MTEYLTGIDVGGTNIKILVMTSDFDVLDWRVISTQKALGYNQISENIICSINEIFSKKQISNPKILSIGMGLPGIVDKKANKTVHLAYIEWNGFNPCEKIGEYFHAPTYIDNDASLNALGEYKFGIKERFKNIVLFTLGTGVGCGIIIDGKVFRGSSNLGAEVGHMAVEVENAEVCYHCGKTGCIEAYCSGVAMARYALGRLPEFPNSILHSMIEKNHDQYVNEFITEGIKAGDELCELVLERFIKYLSVGVSNMMKMFNPELVLIGGGISNAGDLLLVPLAEQTKKRMLHELQYCPIERAILGRDAGMYGACAYAADSLTAQVQDSVTNRFNQSTQR